MVAARRRNGHAGTVFTNAHTRNPGTSEFARGGLGDSRHDESAADIDGDQI